MELLQIDIQYNSLIDRSVVTYSVPDEMMKILDNDMLRKLILSLPSTGASSR